MWDILNTHKHAQEVAPIKAQKRVVLFCIRVSLSPSNSQVVVCSRREGPGSFQHSGQWKTLPLGRVQRLQPNRRGGRGQSSSWCRWVWWVSFLAGRVALWRCPLGTALIFLLFLCYISTLQSNSVTDLCNSVFKLGLLCCSLPVIFANGSLFRQ